MMNEIKSFIKKFSLLMWAAIIITAIAVFPVIVSAQVVGSTKTEEYRASFEKKINIDSLLDYSGPKVPIQLLNIGINEEVFAMYPELKDKRVGLGVTNIIVEYMEETNRFTFTEDKTDLNTGLESDEYLDETDKEEALPAADILFLRTTTSGIRRKKIFGSFFSY